MFDWLKLLEYLENHDERLVENTIINEIEIDTCLADDMGKDYETGLFVKGVWYIAEDYDTKEEAKKGHKKYVELIKNKKLKEVTDIYSGSYTKIDY